jgi:hypothetical protein
MRTLLRAFTGCVLLLAPLSSTAQQRPPKLNAIPDSINL